MTQITVVMKGGGRIIPRRTTRGKAEKFADRDNRIREQSNPKTLTSERKPTGNS
jgi:hypothetical protein